MGIALGIDTSPDYSSSGSENIVGKVLKTRRDEAFLAAMGKGADLVVNVLGNGHKVLSCGNGGSMCDAMHFAEELSGRYRDDRKPFAALSLSDPSALTCIGNDYGFEHVFARQTAALGQPGDLLLALSTSGNSANVLAAAEEAELDFKMADIDALSRRVPNICNRS